MTIRALVLGATGYTGHHVVRLLRGRGVDTVAHVRPDSAQGTVWEERFQSYGATTARSAWMKDEIEELIQSTQPSWIFGLLGTTKKRRKARIADGGDGGQETYETIDRDLTLMAITGAQALGSRPLFIYLSSYGASEGARLPYLRVRGEVERRLAESGLPHIIAQPGFITGPDRPESRPMERVGAIISDALLGTVAALGIGAPRDQWGSMSGETLANGLVTAASGADSATALTLVSRDLRTSAAG